MAAAIKIIHINYYNFNRVNAYIKNGWDKQLVDPDRKIKSTISLAPTDGWQELTEVYGSTSNNVFRFTHAQLLGYFVTPENSS